MSCNAVIISWCSCPRLGQCFSSSDSQCVEYSNRTPSNTQPLQLEPVMFSAIKPTNGRAVLRAKQVRAHQETYLPLPCSYTHGFLDAPALALAIHFPAPLPCQRRRPHLAQQPLLPRQHTLPLPLPCLLSVDKFSLPLPPCVTFALPRLQRPDAHARSLGDSLFALQPCRSARRRRSSAAASSNH